MRAEGTRLESEGTGVVSRRAQVVLWLAAVVVGAFAGSSAGQGPPGGAPPGFDKAIAAKEKHADKWLDKPGVVGVGVGVNKAGKAVIQVYKLKDDDEDIPSEVDGVAVEQVQSGRFDPRALPTDRWPRPVPIGVSSGLAGVATGTLGARVTDGTHVYALSNNHVFAGVNTGEHRGPDHRSRAPTTVARTRRPHRHARRLPGDRLQRRQQPHGRRDRPDDSGDVGTATPPDGYGAPSTIPTAATIGMGVQKYGRTTGFQLGPVQDVNFAVDVCYFAFGGVLLPGLRGALRQPDRRRGRVVQRAGGFRLADGHAGWESAGRAPLRR